MLILKWVSIGWDKKWYTQRQTCTFFMVRPSHHFLAQPLEKDNEIKPNSLRYFILYKLIYLYDTLKDHYV